MQFSIFAGIALLTCAATASPSHWNYATNHTGVAVPTSVVHAAGTGFANPTGVALPTNFVHPSSTGAAVPTSSAIYPPIPAFEGAAGNRRSVFGLVVAGVAVALVSVLQAPLTQDESLIFVQMI
ncbi:hypothetical protein EJ08DRAFT_693015 [Tothia fuscella]|uniref:Uncharacterized protein n=1 Tax=Tothia fuscella TaxID=1048955 RepID=A0A9P4U1W9_9PEZI|nr:hypothetical protein EJ08DRAFT_693015 [Tothia fuscella]